MRFRKIRKAQRKRRAKQIAEFQQQRQKNEPAQLPRRHRPLSTPSTTRTPLLEGSLQSQFLRLPIEVRQQILAEVLGNGALHLVQLPKWLGHIRRKMSKSRFMSDHPSSPSFSRVLSSREYSTIPP